ncbi:MAG: hypothetical protein FWE95_05130 [Planctomycetaceae bacterium]|nr:hypothetical protein [Planctomycetaceae bacterium]
MSIKHLVFAFLAFVVWHPLIAQTTDPIALQTFTEKLRAGVKTSPMLTEMLEGPMNEVESIIFALRVPGIDHWYVSFGHYSGPQPDAVQNAFKEEDGLLWGYGDGGALVKQNLRTGELDVILYDETGGIRDPQVHYDGEKILFAYRKGGTKQYHLYEINVDGTDLTQLTNSEYDDIEPTYTPDGSIIFVSSRCMRYIPCWHVPTTVLYRCDADGQNVRMLSSNNQHDNTPWMLPDGRVLYMRWEYTDRSHTDFHHLWAMNPDGTQQVTFYGNMHAYYFDNVYREILMIDAKPIPNSDKIVSIFSPAHGAPEHMGFITVICPKNGPDDLDSVRLIGDTRTRYKDPYAFSEDCFLAANNDALFIIDGEGRAEQIYLLPEEFRRNRPRNERLAVHEPRPMVPREREPIVGSRIDLSQASGTVVLKDVYHGRSLEGLERGAVKKLLVLKQLPKPVNFSGGPQPMTIFNTFTLAEILGTVPVEEDGSACFEIPALQSVFFVALDENDLAIKRMLSFLTVQPGEVIGCVGCHEHRTEAPISTQQRSTAIRRAPRKPEPIPGVPTIIDFPRDIQPILDKHCVACHSPEEYGGRLDLTGDKTPWYSMSYLRLALDGKYVVDNRNRILSSHPIYEVGSGVSTLMDTIEPSHYEVQLTQEEKNIIRLWIDTSATYPGTYASLRTGLFSVDVDFKQLLSRCGECHATKDFNEARPFALEGWTFPGIKGNTSRDIPRQERWNLTHTPLFNISNPERSMILRAPLAKTAGGMEACAKVIFEDTNDPFYKAVLATLQDANRRLHIEKRFDMPGFRPNDDYIREMQKYGFVKKDLGPTELFDFYQAEQEYFDSWYFDPETGDVKASMNVK